jgi:hypothetical protein
MQGVFGEVQTGDRVTVALPEKAPGQIASVMVLETAGN